MMRIWIAALAAPMLLGGCGSGRPAIERVASDALFERAMAEYQAGRWTAAIRAFDRLVMENPGHPRIHEARFRLADSYYGRKEYLTAASEFTRLATDFPAGPWADDARFKVCEAYRQLSPKVPLDQQYTRAAIDHCRSLVAYYPDSEFVPRADEIVAEMTEKLADKKLYTAEFYHRRRAVDAAILYFEQLADEYPGTAAAPKALLRLVEVYQEIGYTDEAEAARTRLLREYPGTAEARQAESISVAGSP